MSLSFSGQWRIRLLQNAFTRLDRVTSQKNVHHEIMASRNSLGDVPCGFMFKHCTAVFANLFDVAVPLTSLFISHGTP